MQDVKRSVSGVKFRYLRLSVNNRLLIIHSHSRCTFLDSESATGLYFPGLYAALTQLFCSMQNSHNCFVKILHNSE